MSDSGDADAEGAAVGEKPDSRRKLIRLLTVMAYVSSVSGTAFMLSMYYLFLWEPKVAEHHLRADPSPPLALQDPRGYPSDGPYLPAFQTGYHGHPLDTPFWVHAAPPQPPPRPLSLSQVLKRVSRVVTPSLPASESPTYSTTTTETPKTSSPRQHAPATREPQLLQAGRTNKHPKSAVTDMNLSKAEEPRPSSSDDAVVPRMLSKASEPHVDDAVVPRMPSSVPDDVGDAVVPSLPTRDSPPSDEDAVVPRKDSIASTSRPNPVGTTKAGATPSRVKAAVPMTTTSESPRATPSSPSTKSPESVSSPGVSGAPAGKPSSPAPAPSLGEASVTPRPVAPKSTPPPNAGEKPAPRPRASATSPPATEGGADKAGLSAIKDCPPGVAPRVAPSPVYAIISRTPPTARPRPSVKKDVGTRAGTTVASATLADILAGSSPAPPPSTSSPVDDNNGTTTTTGTSTVTSVDVVEASTVSRA